MVRVRSRRARLAPGTQLDPMQVADLRGPARGHFPSALARRHAWESSGDRLMGRRPLGPLQRWEAWWNYRRDVPVRLRRLPDHPDPRLVFLPEPDLPIVVAYQRAKAARQSVEDGRLAFLASHDLIEPSELEAIRTWAPKSIHEQHQLDVIERARKDPERPLHAATRQLRHKET